MRCPDCYGTGHERPYEPWEDCATCDGTGGVDGGWEHDDPNEGIEGPWAEGGACGDKYDYQRGAVGGWRS